MKNRVGPNIHKKTCSLFQRSYIHQPNRKAITFLFIYLTTADIMNNSSGNTGTSTRRKAAYAGGGSRQVASKEKKQHDHRQRGNGKRRSSGRALDPTEEDAPVLIVPSPQRQSKRRSSSASHRQRLSGAASVSSGRHGEFVNQVITPYPGFDDNVSVLTGRSAGRSVRTGRGSYYHRPSRRDEKSVATTATTGIETLEERTRRLEGLVSHLSSQLSASQAGEASFGTGRMSGRHSLRRPMRGDDFDDAGSVATIESLRDQTIRLEGLVRQLSTQLTIQEEEKSQEVGSVRGRSSSLRPSIRGDDKSVVSIESLRDEKRELERRVNRKLSSSVSVGQASNEQLLQELTARRDSSSRMLLMQDQSMPTYMPSSNRSYLIEDDQGDPMEIVDHSRRSRYGRSTSVPDLQTTTDYDIIALDDHSSVSSAPRMVMDGDNMMDGTDDIDMQYDVANAVEMQYDDDMYGPTCNTAKMLGMAHKEHSWNDTYVGSTPSFTTSESDEEDDVLVDLDEEDEEDEEEEENLKEYNEPLPELEKGKPSCNEQLWYSFSFLITFWFPSCCIPREGAGAKQAWREKVAICFIALFFSVLLVGGIGFLPLFLCRESDR